MPDLERLVRMEAVMEAHVASDKSAFDDLKAATGEIKQAVRDLSQTTTAAVERIHVRIDETAAKARHDAANIAQVARGETKVAMDFAQDAHDKIAAVMMETRAAISNQKIWVLANAVLFLFAIAAWLADHFFGRGHV